MCIFYLLLFNGFFVQTHDSDINNSARFQLPLKQTVVSYKNKSGIFSLERIKDMNDNEFESIVSNFEKAINIKDPEHAQGWQAIEAQIKTLYFANQKPIIKQQIEAQDYLASARFCGLIKRFHIDMSQLLKELNESYQHAKVERFELPCGLMTYVKFNESYGQAREMERFLNALYIERNHISPLNKLLKHVSNNEPNMLSNQYARMRLMCFEEMLRFALKNDWDGMYDLPGQILMNDILVRALTGRYAQFLYQSKNCSINEFIHQDRELSRKQDILESLLIQLSKIPFIVNSLQFYNNECILYGKPPLNTPTQYYYYLITQRKNYWMCRYIQFLYKQANGFCNESCFNEERAFDKDLKEIIIRVFKEFDLHDDQIDGLKL